MKKKTSLKKVAQAMARMERRVVRRRENPNVPTDLPPADTAATALLRCLPTKELQAAYRRAKSDETDKGQHSACLIGRELTRRAGLPGLYVVEPS